MRSYVRLISNSITGTACTHGLVLQQVSLLLLVLLLVHVSILVRRHLTQAHHCVLTVQTVVVRLLAGMYTISLGAGLRGGELLKSSSHDGVEFLVLPPVCHHLVSVRADEITLETVEVRGFVLSGTCGSERLKYS